MKKLRTFFMEHSSFILLLVAIIIALANYLVYPTLIMKDMELIEIPIASNSLKENTRVEETDLVYIKINPDQLPEGIILDKNEIIGRYIQDNHEIVKNSFFYKEQLVNENEFLGNVFHNLEDNESAYTLLFDYQYNSSDAIRKGMRIDVYYVSEIRELQNHRYLVGKILKNVLVLDIQNASNDKEYLTISVSDSDLDILMIAENSGSLIPIVSSYSNQYLIDEEDLYDIDALKVYLYQENTSLKRTNNEY